MKTSKPNLRQVLAANLKNFREKHDLSQEELADKCGLHRTYIGSVERCERNVSLNTLELLANSLKTTVPELLSQKENN